LLWDIIYNIIRKVGFTGINLAGEEPDFLDRSVTLHLSRIKKENRMTEKNCHQILKELEYVIHPLVYNNFLALPLVKSGFKNESGHVPGVTDIL